MAYIICPFTTLITTVWVKTGEAFQLLVSMSQAVCEIHLITACLPSVSHNYLHSSSPLASLRQSTDYCKLTEFLTDKSGSELQTFFSSWMENNIWFFMHIFDDTGNVLSFENLYSKIQFSLQKKKIGLLFLESNSERTPNVGVLQERPFL